MSPWTEFVKMHINKCPGATPQARMRACAAMYRNRRHGGGKRAGSVFTTPIGPTTGKGVRSIMPARQGVGLHVGAGAPPKRRMPVHHPKARSQQALAAAIHGLVAHGHGRR